MYSFPCSLSSWEGGLCVPRALKEWRVVRLSLEGGYLSSGINYLELFCMKDLIYSSLFLESFISLRTHGYYLYLGLYCNTTLFILFLKNSSFGHSISVSWLLHPSDPHLHGKVGRGLFLFLSPSLLYGT